MKLYRWLSGVAVCLLVFTPGMRGDDLPDEAKKLLEELNQEITAIHKKAEDDVKARTEKYIESLQKMQDTYTKAGKLDEAVAIRDKIRSLKASQIVAQADPGTLGNFRGQNGQVFHFEVTGANTGSVWGTDVYTDDSHLATVAVHAGVLQIGQKGIVRVTILAGQANYLGSTRNGVTTGNWDAFGGSYKVEATGLVRPKKAAVNALPDPGNLVGYRNQVGKTFTFEVTGRLTGSVWGTGVYTDDSDIGTVAVHSGILRDGQKGVVKVTILPGQPNYTGNTLNGVTSRDYGPWDGSYSIEPVK